MDSRSSSILYGILGLYSLMISWYYNHSIILLIVHYLLWPIYLVYELLIGHLAHDTFSNVLAFTFALSAIGLAVIFAGIFLQRRQRVISAFLDASMPTPLRALRPARALPL